MKKRKKSVDFSLGKKEKVKVNPKAAGRIIINTALIVFAAIVLGYGLITFCVQTVYMTGSSMESVISDGDELILNKMAYKASKIRRYDVVAIKKIGSDDYYDIKRVIGLPGETVQIAPDGSIIVDGNILKESYGKEVIRDSGTASDPITLGEDEYFVLGDNRNDSRDSRWPDVGNIHKSKIVGKAVLRLTPFSKFGRVK